MIIVKESEAVANPEKIQKLAKKYEIVIVRDCDFQATIQLILKRFPDKSP